MKEHNRENYIARCSGALSSPRWGTESARLGYGRHSACGSSFAGFLFAHHSFDLLTFFSRHFVKGAIFFTGGFALFRRELAPFFQAVMEAFFLFVSQAWISFGGLDQAASLYLRQGVPLLVQRGKSFPLRRAQRSPGY